MCLHIIQNDPDLHAKMQRTLLNYQYMRLRSSRNGCALSSVTVSTVP
jgi:hypothetical protein